MSYYRGKKISELNYIKKKHGHSKSKISLKEKLTNLKAKTERQLKLINKEIRKTKGKDYTKPYKKQKLKRLKL